MHPTDPARPVNGDCPFPALDGPPISVKGWARIFDVEPQTILEWIEKHNIRAKSYGRTSMILPKDMWECVPYANVEPDIPKNPNPKRKR